jgi:AcrR family transcriptional regulator
VTRQDGNTVRTERTRRRILDESLRLFNEHGEESVTTADIAAALGISPGNLYYHYRNKDQIVSELFGRLEERLDIEPRVDGDAAQAIEDLWLYLHLMLEGIWDFRFFYRNLHGVARRDRRLRERFNRIARRSSPPSRPVQQASQRRERSARRREIPRARPATVLLVATVLARFPGTAPRAATMPADPGRGAYQVMMLIAPISSPGRCAPPRPAPGPRLRRVKGLPWPKLKWTAFAHPSKSFRVCRRQPSEESWAKAASRRLRAVPVGCGRQEAVAPFPPGKFGRGGGEGASRGRGRRDGGQQGAGHLRERGGEQGEREDLAFRGGHEARASSGEGRAEKCQRALPLRLCRGRYSQRILVVKALSQGYGGKIRAALESALKLSRSTPTPTSPWAPTKRKSSTRWARWWAGLTYGANAKEGESTFRKALELAPIRRSRDRDGQRIGHDARQEDGG